jgi:hypothetical protein
MIVIEASKNKTGVKTIPGSETTVEVEIPVVFADTKHSRVRQGDREISSEEAIGLVKAALPRVLDAVTKDNITKTQNGDPWFTVVDKQSCGVVGCTIEADKTLKQKVLIRTVFFRDQYHTLDTSKTIFYVNEDNPSEAWEAIEYYSNLYNTNVIHQGYRGYDKQLDQEHPETNPLANKKREMDQVWAEPDRLGNDYTMAKRQAAAQDNDMRMRNQMGYGEYNLPKAMDAADNRILTKRGPNGTLRGIDRRRKAAERKLNKIVKEEIKRYYESI